MNEYTQIKYLDLPHGRPWEWYGDANVIVLAPRFRTDCQGREQALTEVQAHWRRSCIRVVQDDEANVTQPMLPLVRLPTSLLAGEG